MPALQGSYFANNLILICEHNADGALGLVLNKPSSATLEELLTELELPRPAQLNPAQIDVHEGGPVARERGFVLHSGKYTTTESQEVCQGLYLAGTHETLAVVVANAQHNEFIFLLGYAGWDAGQLEAEIHDNSWLTCDATPEVIFERPADQRIQAAIDQLGFDYRLLTTEAGHA